MNYNKNIRNIFLLIIISMIYWDIYTVRPFSYSPQEAEELQQFIEKNEGFITNEDKKILDEIIIKFNNYRIISQEEREYIRECKLNVIRQKLGDAQFEEYKRLIEKRSSGAEFQQPERFRLYELERMLKN